MDFKQALSCNICRLVLTDPVSLPCYCVVCGHHIFERNMLKNNIRCKTCERDFDVPKDGFKSNNMFQVILNSDFHLTHDEKRLKCHIGEISESTKLLINEIEEKKKHLQVVCQDHFTKICKQINSNQGDIKKKIEDISLSLVDKTKKKMDFFIKQINDHALTAEQYTDLTNLNEAFRQQIIDIKKLEKK